MFKSSITTLLSASTAFGFLLFVSCSENKPMDPEAQVPVVSTAAVNEITQTTAECGGIIISDGGATLALRGVCWSTDSTPSIADSRTNDGAGMGSFTSSISGLSRITPYNVRAYATNSAGTGYGSIVSFMTTDSMGTMTDIDGNTYRTIKIGNQWWMAENLKAIHYRDRDTIGMISDSSKWASLTKGAFCNYDNDTALVAIYGRLYNWYAVDDSSNIAPEGWHVPSDSEWQTLIDYLGGGPFAGAKMKETGTSHWHDPNSGATNESGFSGLPGGYRSDIGAYSTMGSYAYFWSATQQGSLIGWCRHLGYASPAANRDYHYMTSGFSIRCVKD
jgi:uncharacterized protein (TIGR02145 family)